MDAWYPGAEKIPSAAFWPGMDPAFLHYSALMVHIMQGYQTTLDAWARQRPPVVEKSAHVSINRAGRTVQYVALGSRSWTAGSACAPTWPLIAPSQRPGAVPQRSMNHTVFNVECEGFSKPPTTYGYDYVYDAARPWPEPLLASLVAVGVWFFRQTGLAPDPIRIIGHRDTDSCTRADDPGWAFPMAAVQARIAAGVTGTPTTPLPPDTAVDGLRTRIVALEAAQGAQEAILRGLADRLDRHLAP
jgi:hypothetical protein